MDWSNSPHACVVSGPKYVWCIKLTKVFIIGSLKDTFHMLQFGRVHFHRKSNFLLLHLPNLIFDSLSMI